MVVQDDRGSLLTKGSLYNHFYRADARHEISGRKARIFVSQSVQSGSLWMAMAELLQNMCNFPGFLMKVMQVILYLALVNQEVIIGGSELGISGYPCFNADFSLWDTLVRTGFNVICHATNHAMDKGRAGLISCAQHWREQYCLRFF